MNFLSLFQSTTAQRWALIVLAVAVSLLAGLSFLVFDMLWTPLIIGGGIVALGVGIMWLQKPVWAMYAAVFMMTIPEGLLPSALNSILNRLTLIMALLVWLLNMISQKRQIVWTATSLILVGFLVWSMMSLFWASDSQQGVEDLLQYTFRLVLFMILILNEINSDKSMNDLMNTLAVSGWILVFVVIINFLLQGYAPGKPIQILNVNRNSISEYFILTMPGVLWQVIKAPAHRRRMYMLFSVVYILLTLILTALTGSRGGIIAIVATLLTFWLWKPTRSWGRLGLLLLILAVVVAPFVFTVTIERFTQSEGGILGGRYVIWQAGFKLILDHLWLGVGIGNAKVAVIPYLRVLTEIGGRIDRSLHNPILQIWAETGIIGLLLYMGVLVSAVYAFFKQYLQRDQSISYLPESYYALIFCTFVGIMFAWIKGGGMEDAPSYFFILAMMLIPSCAAKVAARSNVDNVSE